jgi:hypothetical protein
MLVQPVKAKAHVAVDPRWVTSIVLRALVQLAPRKGANFTAATLASHTADLPAVRRQRAVTKLLGLGYITYKRFLVDGRSESTYTVTADGAAAIAAAGQGAMLMSGTHGTKPPGAGSLRSRLWALMRIRKVLDAEEAVQLLADAGDPAFISKRNKANECFRRWHLAGVLQLSAKVGPKGQKRYVLPVDPGPAVPPFITPIAAKAMRQAHQ